MFDILVQLNGLAQIIEISIHTDADITALLRLIEHLLMASFSSAHDRRQKLNLRPLRKRHNLIRHLVYGLTPDLTSALRTVRNADSRVKKTEIIVDLRDRSHGGTRIVVGGLLVNGDGRRKSLYTFHIRLFHLSEKLSRIGGQ